MTARMGGESPINLGGLTITCEAPTGTDSATPVAIGQVFKLGGTAADSSGYKAAALLATDDPNTCVMIQAISGTSDLAVPFSAKVLGPYQQIRRALYEGSPTIGQSIDAAATSQRKVEGVTWAAGQGYITFVDTATTEVEFII